MLSWWSWRPGIRPRSALLIGAPLVIVALLMLSMGLLTVTLGLLDSAAQPVVIVGRVVGHSTGVIDRLPRLAISLRAPGYPELITPSVSQSAFQALHDGEEVRLLFSPHLHTLTALESGDRRYTIQGSGLAGRLSGPLALLILGLAFLPYPALLTLWGWRDLRGARRKIVARVIALRATERQRRSHTGLTPRITRPAWYGVALQPLEAPLQLRPLIFSIDRATYERLREDMLVHLSYSSELRYVYALERVEEEV